MPPPPPAPSSPKDVLLHVEGLRTQFSTDDGLVRAVDDVSFEVGRGEVVGIVGESGCGKSVTNLSILGLLPKPQGKIAAGRVIFEGRDLVGLPEKELQKVRGNRIAMIFQDPMTSLNPFLTVEEQLAEVGQLHLKLSREEAVKRAVALLERVGISDPAARIRSYPHEFSGGMRQRVMIAMALLCDPALLIADEPTTALDVTIQAQILDLLRELRKERGMSIILITHDLGVVAGICDRILVMYAGRVVEEASTRDLFRSPAHPYTRALLRSVPRVAEEAHGRLANIEGIPPRLDREFDACPFAPRCVDRREACLKGVPPLVSTSPGRARRCVVPVEELNVSADKAPAKASGEPLLEVEGLYVHFPSSRGPVRAVDGVSFDLFRGETLGLVGESGCGKSTTARAIVGLVPVTEGSIRFDGEEIGNDPAALRRARPRLQMVFQDPYASLNPRMTVASIVGEPLVIHRRIPEGTTLDGRVCELLATVGLDPSMRRRYPHEFSGGQRQRIGLARSLALNPDVILLDEPVSALDVSVQAQVLNLLEDLRKRLGLTYLFIAHNLGVVRHVSDRIAVMYLGRIVELCSRQALFSGPLHPYAEALLSAVPVPDPEVEATRRRIPIEGEIPSPTARIDGCPFRSRCPKAYDRCRVEAPLLKEHRPGRFAACHLPEDQR